MSAFQAVPLTATTLLVLFGLLAQFVLEKKLYARSTKQNLFVKFFHRWVQLCAMNLMSLINS